MSAYDEKKKGTETCRGSRDGGHWAQGRKRAKMHSPKIITFFLAKRRGGEYREQIVNSYMRGQGMYYCGIDAQPSLLVVAAELEMKEK
jgi:hypothetical protein